MIRNGQYCIEIFICFINKQKLQSDKKAVGSDSRQIKKPTQEMR